MTGRRFLDSGVDAERPCARCGRLCPPHQLSPNMRRKYCSRSCANQASREKRPDHQRRHRLRKYGLTVEGYAALRAEQGDRCAICAAAESGTLSGEWNIDHDHVSGKVRGLLCMSCNIGIGWMRDDPTRLRAAAEYLGDDE